MRDRLPILPLIFLAAVAPARAAAVPAAAETLYRQGVLPSGKPLRGEREAGIRIEGADAACVNCHRRSGLGSAEGQSVIPPITGKYLFRPRGRNPEDMDFRYTQSFSLNRDPYTEASLAQAIREGIGKNGRKLSYLMPHYKIDDAAMASLIAYLKDLSTGPVPGVTEDTLHFATIITADADPLKRQGMLDVLEHFFADKNSFIRGGNRTLQNSKGIEYRVTRKWQLHVWELKGPADGWERQLHERLAAEPVFAVISGLGGKTWTPVHRFCERESIPCLLPNVELPVVAEKDFYPVYFSKGVLLEAQLISRQLRENREKSATRRLVQLYREDDVGAEAAAALRTATASFGLETVNRALQAGDPAQVLADALKEVGPDDALVLWLRPEDLRSLPAAATRHSTIFLSGLMGGLEQAPLPRAWRSVARLSYPFDLPEQRKLRMNYPLAWFKIKRIPVVAERVQSDTYLALGVLAENLTEMLDSFVRDYLVERVESMLSKRPINGYYPRLGLAPGQRFASKGGYLVRFAEPEGTRLVADGNWIVP